MRSLFRLSVCMFVRLSVCNSFDMWANRGLLQNQFKLPDTPRIWLDCEKNSAKIFTTFYFPQGLLCRRAMKKSRFSTHISFYLQNNKRIGIGDDTKAADCRRPKLHYENKKIRSVERGCLSHCQTSVNNCFPTQNVTEIGQSPAELWSKNDF